MNGRKYGAQVSFRPGRTTTGPYRLGDSSFYAVRTSNSGDNAFVEVLDVNNGEVIGNIVLDGDLIGELSSIHRTKETRLKVMAANPENRAIGRANDLRRARR